MTRSRNLTQLIALMFLFLFGQAIAAAASAQGGRTMGHPAVVFLDANGDKVIASGGPVSTSRTCAACHDTDYMVAHNYHSWLGANETEFTKAHAFDSGPGPLERLDPLLYEQFDRHAGANFDLGLADWLRRYGYLHIGGGLATHKPDGTDLRSLPRGKMPNPYTDVNENGQIRTWDWQASGVAEMNCFLCHLAEPANEERIAELTAGNFGTAATATLAKTELVSKIGGSWQWNTAKFADDGSVPAGELKFGRPQNANCAQCHGYVDTGADVAFFVAPDRKMRRTETSGQIISPHRIRRSGMNLVGKDELSRSWDVHAERLLQCVDCHGSLNNPTVFRESSETSPSHLRSEVRRLSYGEYLRTPSHDLAKGNSSHGDVAGDLDGTMKTCVDCHTTQGHHDWLPSQQRHLQALQCEACHVPKIFAPARMQSDWTFLSLAGEALVTYRGYSPSDETPDISNPATLIAGYEPLLLARRQRDGSSRLSPQNLASNYYWLDEETGRPVPLQTLRAALFVDPAAPESGYRPQIVTAFDDDGSGTLSVAEMRLVTDEKIQVVKDSLAKAGVADAKIQGDLQPYGLHHNVATGAWATKECASCHGGISRFTADFAVGEYAPGGVIPQLVADTPVSLAGKVAIDAQGRLLYHPDPALAGVTLIGSKMGGPVDVIGGWAVLLVLLGVLVHGGIRVFLSLVSGPLAEAKKRSDEEDES